MEKQLTIEDSETKEVWTWEVLDTYVHVTYRYTEFGDPEMDDFSFQYIPNEVFEAVVTDYEQTNHRNPRRR
jgi:hypothetical protein